MALVCLDSHVLIWGLKEQSEPGQENMVRTAKAFLGHLDSNGTDVLVPSIVVAELLMRVPLHMHNMVSNLMAKCFIVSPFDLCAAMHFARIWQTAKNSQAIEDLVTSGRPAREEVKVDCMIIATALANHASCIYSHDDDLEKLADGHIQVERIPTIVEQMQLFGQADKADESLDENAQEDRGDT